MSLNKLFMFSEQKACLPVSISNRIHPKLHQSTSFEYAHAHTISGARYSGVPANVFALSVSSTFASPKSVSLMWP